MNATWRKCMRRAAEVVGGGDDRPPSLRLRLEDPHQVFLGRDVHAGDRLVEEVEVGLARPSARARKTRRRCPPDSWPIWRPVASAMPTGLERLAATASRSAAPGERPIPMSGTRPIITTSPTVTGKRPVDELRLRDVGDPARLATRGDRRGPRQCRRTASGVRRSS